MSISLKADPSGTFGEILVNGAVVAKLPLTGNAVIPGLVGTVSQSGGVPTGAVVERGSNANGEYVRFADGTQICRGVTPSSTSSNVYAGTSLFLNTATATMPAAFVGARVWVSGGREDETLTNGWVDASATSTTASVIHWSNNNTSVAVLSYVAIGRWY